jgi:hypothetical protein
VVLVPPFGTKFTPTLRHHGFSDAPLLGRRQSSHRNTTSRCQRQATVGRATKMPPTHLHLVIHLARLQKPSTATTVIKAAVKS